MKPTEQIDYADYEQLSLPARNGIDEAFDAATAALAEAGFGISGGDRGRKLKIAPLQYVA